MRRYRVLLLLLTVAILAAPGTAEAQKTCKKGKPCGDTCIAKEKTCRVAEGGLEDPTSLPHSSWRRQGSCPPMRDSSRPLKVGSTTGSDAMRGRI